MLAVSKSQGQGYDRKSEYYLFLPLSRDKTKMDFWFSVILTLLISTRLLRIWNPPIITWFIWMMTNVIMWGRNCFLQKTLLIQNQNIQVWIFLSENLIVFYCIFNVCTHQVWNFPKIQMSKYFYWKKKLYFHNQIYIYIYVSNSISF